MNPRRVEVLGLLVDVLTRVELLDRVEEFVTREQQGTVTYVNLHVLDLASRDPDLAAFLLKADLCYCDGEGVRLVARILGERLPERITGADWIWDLAARAEGRWRLAWIGGEPGVTEAAANRLRHRYAGLEISAFQGHLSAAETGWVLQALERIRPHVVLVGMGTPIQERWVRDHRSEIRAPVVWCLGGTADVVSGRVDRGPPHLYRHQEWAARLLADPLRLWRRYLVEAPRVLARALATRADANLFRDEPGRTRGRPSLQPTASPAGPPRTGPDPSGPTHRPDPGA